MPSMISLKLSKQKQESVQARPIKNQEHLTKNTANPVGHKQEPKEQRLLPHKTIGLTRTKCLIFLKFQTEMRALKTSRAHIENWPGNTIRMS